MPSGASKTVMNREAMSHPFATVMTPQHPLSRLLEKATLLAGRWLIRDRVLAQQESVRADLHRTPSGICEF